MPITPFHFGPGAAIHALAPRRISFLAFGASNVLIDLEPLYFMLTGQDPLHRFFHTYIGASLVASFAVLLFMGCRSLSVRFPLPNPFKWQGLGVWPVVAGAFAGTYSHIALDSIMHFDIRPLAPFSNANPFYLAVSIDDLHRLCVVAGAIGLGVLGVRRLLRLVNVD